MSIRRGAVAATPAIFSRIEWIADENLEPHCLFEQSLPGTATLFTTAADAARFADVLLTGHVLTETSLDEMLDTSAMRDLPCPALCPIGYGLGMTAHQAPSSSTTGTTTSPWPSSPTAATKTCAPSSTQSSTP